MVLRKAMIEKARNQHIELQLITLKEACEMLKVHPNTMR